VQKLNKAVKKLYIARHAKSSWDDMSVSDHDRDILEKGVKRTLKVAGYLKEKGEIPSLIISSSAKRALKTARLFAEVFRYPVENILVSASLYGCHEDDIFEELYGLSANVTSVMVVGHNPAFTGFANLFLKNGHKIDNLPTSGVVAVKLKIDDWEKVYGAASKMLFKAFPKDL
jgi:phosphohistidine phosphatase